MLQKDLIILSPDSNKIYGTLLTNNNNKNLVIHLHGFTSTMNSLIEVNSAEYFLSKNYDHFRFDFYSPLQGSRTLLNSSISTHLKDTKSVIDYFDERYENIFVTAHSLGGLVMMILNPQNVKAVSLWDPATDIYKYFDVFSCLKHIPSENYYQVNFGTVYCVSEEMMDEFKYYTDSVVQDITKQIITPTQIIVPEEGVFTAYPGLDPQSYRVCYKGDIEIVNLSGANHSFSNYGNCQILFDSTIQWFESYL